MDQWVVVYWPSEDAPAGSHFYGPEVRGPFATKDLAKGYLESSPVANYWRGKPCRIQDPTEQR